MKFLGYQCSKCGELYDPTEAAYTCPEDGSNLDVRIDYASIKDAFTVESISSEREGSIWRYLPLLPVGTLAIGALSCGRWGGRRLFDPARWPRDWGWRLSGSRTTAQSNGIIKGPGQRGGGGASDGDRSADRDYCLDW